MKPLTTHEIVRLNGKRTPVSAEAMSTLVLAPGETLIPIVARVGYYLAHSKMQSGDPELSRGALFVWYHTRIRNPGRFDGATIVQFVDGTTDIHVIKVEEVRPHPPKVSSFRGVG